MHHKIRKVIRYAIWLVLGVILAVLLFGALSYQGTLRDYVDFLNERNRSEASEQISSNPISRPYLLLPTDKETQQSWETTVLSNQEEDTDDEVEDDIDWFFADFESSIDVQEDDFGFSNDTWSTQTGSTSTASWDVSALTEDQKQRLLELFKDRQVRIKARSEFEQSLRDEMGTGDVQTGADQE